jgi:hypothetical protein
MPKRKVPPLRIWIAVERVCNEECLRNETRAALDSDPELRSDWLKAGEMDVYRRDVDIAFTHRSSGRCAVHAQSPH